MHAFVSFDKNQPFGRINSAIASRRRSQLCEAFRPEHRTSWRLYRRPVRQQPGSANLEYNLSKRLRLFFINHIGKTAPRLIHDVQLYDAAHEPDTGRNLLSETPPIYPEGYNGPPGFISPEACRHNYVLKEDQTFMSEPEHRRRPGTSSKVSAICAKCRYHLQVVVNYTSHISTFSQKQGKHLHHLVYQSGRQKNGLALPEVTPKGQVAETYHYQCSYISCSAMVSLRILSPILSPESIRLLTDKDLLRKRAEEATATYPESMEGMGDPQPINVLDNLRLYITNALRNPQRSKPISSVNKRFMHSFGVEGAASKELLEFLEFMYNKVRNNYMSSNCPLISFGFMSLTNRSRIPGGTRLNRPLTPKSLTKTRCVSFSTTCCMSC